jgi:hypothetical protein
MLTEEQEIALQNLAILSETQTVEIVVHDLTLDDGIKLIQQLTHDTPKIRFSDLTGRYHLEGRGPGDFGLVRVVCAQLVTVTPFDTIPEETDEVIC